MASVSWEWCGEIVTLTDEVAASNYVQPVLMVRGSAYGAGDVIVAAHDDPMRELFTIELAGRLVLCSLQQGLIPDDGKQLAQAFADAYLQLPWLAQKLTLMRALQNT